MPGYPVILGGDHAEFEREHANTPPHERPDWPLPSFDARDWAAAFCKICKEKGFDPVADEDWIQSWFANALMRGFDEAVSRSHEAELAKALKDTLNMLRACHMQVGVHHDGLKRVITARAVLAKAEPPAAER